MSQCTSTPISTQFTTVTGSLASTSFVESVTTLPDTTSTVLSTSCLDTASASADASGGGTCLSSTVITSTTVITGGVQTTSVPTTVIVFQTTTEAVQTVFSTSCGTSTPPTTTPPTTSPTPSDTSTSSTATTSTFVTTPTSTFTTSVETTLPNGSVTQALTTITSVLPALTSTLTTAVPAPSTQQGNGGSGGSSSNMGAIVGGAVGGGVGLIALLLALWFYYRRRRNWDDIFEKDYDEFANAQAVNHGRFGRNNLLDTEDDPPPPLSNLNSEPKPYVYGLVGSQNAMSPPSMNAGLQDTATLGARSRTLSETPLMVNAVSSAASSRPTSFGAGSNSGHGHMPETPPPARRSASPGPLGVLIDAGPGLGLTSNARSPPDSPTSPTHQRKLFIANQDPLASPASPEMKRRSLNTTPGTSSFGGAMASSSPPSTYPQGEKQDLGRSNTTSSHSVYSQASSPQSPVIVHKDAGPVPPIPPQYRN